MRWPDKYRPVSLDGVLGQDDVKSVLRRLPRGARFSFLFVGPHGVGKSVIASVLKLSHRADVFDDVDLLGSEDARLLENRLRDPDCASVVLTASSVQAASRFAPFCIVFYLQRLSFDCLVKLVNAAVLLEGCADRYTQQTVCDIALQARGDGRKALLLAESFLHGGDTAFPDCAGVLSLFLRGDYGKGVRELYRLVEDVPAERVVEEFIWALNGVLASRYGGGCAGYDHGWVEANGDVDVSVVRAYLRLLWAVLRAPGDTKLSLLTAFVLVDDVPKNEEHVSVDLVGRVLSSPSKWENSNHMLLSLGKE